LSSQIAADLFTPTQAYLKVSENSKLSFLYESAATTGTIGRYSFVGANPLKVINLALVMARRKILSPDSKKSCHNSGLPRFLHFDYRP